MQNTIKVGGMHCRSCELLIEDSVGDIQGIGAVKADHEKGTVQVEIEREGLLERVKKAIEKEGYRVIG